MSCFIKPLRERFLQRNRNGLIRRLLLECGYCEVVNWCVLLCFAGDVNLVTPPVGSDINSTLFNVKDPEGKGSVEDGINCYCDCRVEFCIVEAELVVPVEGCGADCKSSVA